MKIKINGKLYDTKTAVSIMADGDKVLCKTQKGNFFFYQKNEKTGKYIIIPVKCFEAYRWIESFEWEEVSNFAASPEITKILKQGG